MRVPCQEWANNDRYDLVSDALFERIPPMDGVWVNCSQGVLTEKSLQPHYKELGPLVATAVRDLRELPRESEDQPVSRTMRWREHRLEIILTGLPTQNSLVRPASIAQGQDEKEAARAVKEKLPKLLRRAIEKEALAVLVIEDNQIAFSRIMLAKALEQQLREQSLPRRFIALITETSLHYAPDIVVVWDEQGSTLSPFDHNRLFWSHHRRW